jgi:hypothetical protein
MANYFLHLVMMGFITATGNQGAAYGADKE